MSDLDLLVARATTAGIHRVYKLGEVPAVPVGASYAVLAVDPGQRAGTRVSGDSPGLTRRITAQLFASTDDGIQDLVARADAAFYDQTLTEFDDDPFCIRELAVGPIRDPDGGSLLYILHTYRF